MITAEQISAPYGRNLHFVNQLTGDFSHAESLIQPPAKGNCANWIVGHIVAYRNRLLEILGEPPTLDPQLAQRYANGSAPVLGDEAGITPFADLLAALEAAQVAIARALPQISSEQANQSKNYGQFTMSVVEWVIFLLRHEAYHVGQLELLREVVRTS